MTTTDIRISDCLDWLRVTLDRSTPLDVMLPPFPALSRTGEILDHGYYGYNRAMPLENGGHIMYHTEKPEMKMCIDLPGSVLAEVRRDGFDVEEIMAHFVARRLPDLRYKRIDYAIDVENAPAEPGQLWARYEKGKVKTTARTARFIRSHESDMNADTVEFGSRESSPRFIRVYNKAAQTGMLWKAWTRIEAEIKLARADGFAASILKHGRSKAGRREISEAVKVKLGWFEEAMKGELAPHLEVPRPDSKPNKFVLETIIPFIRNHAEELTEEVKRKLLATIADEIDLPI